GGRLRSARAAIAEAVSASFGSAGSVMRRLTMPASLKNGWCQGTNGVGCQPLSSYTASTGSQLVRKVPPCHCPQRPWYGGSLSVYAISIETDSSLPTAFGNGTTNAVRFSS